jgi:hypothetical protein
MRYNQRMLIEDEDERPSKDDEEKDDRYQETEVTAKDRKSEGSRGKVKGKKTRKADHSKSKDNSAVELNPVRPKIPESGDTLKKRSDYFKKRH